MDQWILVLLHANYEAFPTGLSLSYAQEHLQYWRIRSSTATEASPTQASLLGYQRDWWLNQWIQRGDSMVMSPIRYRRAEGPAATSTLYTTTTAAEDRHYDF